MFYDDEISYKKYLQELFQDVLEINELNNSINPQYAKLNQFIKCEIDNKSVCHVNERGAARWERILAVSSPINSTLQSRRNALKAKLMSRPPINIETLRAVVETYLGVPVDIIMWWGEFRKRWGELESETWSTLRHKNIWGDFYVKRFEPYIIYIYYKGETKLIDITPLYSTIYDMIPANLIVNILYNYDTWGDVVNKFTWETAKQKSWEDIWKGL